MDNPEHPGILHVGWRVGQETSDGRVNIFSIGKWGGENTPETIAENIQKNTANHIVALHNRTLQE